ncbi:hypothetical protein SmJEL517_g01477 [Synchytrium microbalum]|uniref:Rhomboid-type serine protease n=1 Tax=Synchytrium microbalum TaxID=1806994 RepID=A0A507C959_9FUNG|nr:uncharacterized protein SmJEL517_g01477 [Synchytrium microbalum]TPX36132.1 hypothetical protein SmJEL517_g01477 [Synchytrium microbalum]
MHSSTDHLSQIPARTLSNAKRVSYRRPLPDVPSDFEPTPTLSNDWEMKALPSTESDWEMKALPSTDSLSTLLRQDSSADLLQETKDLESTDEVVDIPRRRSNAPPTPQTRFEKFCQFLLDMEEKRYIKHKPLVPNKARARIMSHILLFIHVVLLIAMLGYNHGFASLSVNPMMGPDVTTLTVFGGNTQSAFRHQPAQVVSANLWRFFVAMFLHSGLIHLTVNVACEISVGRNVVLWLGYRPVLAIWLISGIGGNAVAAVLRTQMAVSVGSSGPIMGLFGANVADIVMNWKDMDQPKWRLVYWIINSILIFASSLMPFVDNLVHVAGFVTGFGAGLLLLTYLGHDQRKYYIFKGVGFILSIGITYMSVAFLLAGVQVADNAPWLCHILLSIKC